MLVIEHVENTKYEEELKRVLAETRPAYFYDIADVLLDLDLEGAEDFIPCYGDIAFLVSNQPLSNEQLLAEVKQYLPEAEPDEEPTPE
jgi:hypothetical protein